MFTNKYSRTKESRDESIDPFNEPDTHPNGTKQASTGYMAELEQWLDEVIFEPIERAIANEDSKELNIAFSESKQLLKKKVLASYHNGLKAKSTSNPKKYGQQNYRRD